MCTSKHASQPLSRDLEQRSGSCFAGQDFQQRPGSYFAGQDFQQRPGSCFAGQDIQQRPGSCFAGQLCLRPSPEEEEGGGVTRHTLLLRTCAAGNSCQSCCRSLLSLDAKRHHPVEADSHIRLSCWQSHQAELLEPPLQCDECTKLGPLPSAMRAQYWRRHAKP